MIDKTVDSLDTAVAGISDGATVLVSGFGGSVFPARCSKRCWPGRA